MLTHIVIWKYRVDIEQEVREEHVGLLRALVGAIPELMSLSVGFDVLRLPRSYDMGAGRCLSRSRGARSLLIPHTLKSPSWVESISEHVASVDFED